MATNQVAKWIGGQKYRGHAVEGEIQIELLKSVNQTRVVEVLLECRMGDMNGRRMKWRGWLNSESNAKKTRDALVAMGWRGSRWGDWTGIGSKEVEWTATAEKRMVEGEERTFWLAAFVRSVAKLAPKNPASVSDIDALNKVFGAMLSNGTAAPASMPPTDDAPPVTEAPADDIPF